MWAETLAAELLILLAPMRHLRYNPGVGPGKAKGGCPMVTPRERYVVDARGRKTGVILSLKQYQRLMEDLYDLARVADRRDEEPVALEEVKRRLKEDGLLLTLPSSPQPRRISGACRHQRSPGSSAVWRTSGRTHTRRRPFCWLLRSDSTGFASVTTDSSTPSTTNFPRSWCTWFAIAVRRTGENSLPAGSHSPPLHAQTTLSRTLAAPPVSPSGSALPPAVGPPLSAPA